MRDPSKPAGADWTERQAPVVRLTPEGIAWGAHPRAGDEIGYAMHPTRGDDCFQAAIATCTQIPMEQVPDLNLDRRFAKGEDRDEISRSSWERIEFWAKRRGFMMGYSKDVPLSLDRWIGVCEWEGNARFKAMPPEFWRAARESRHGTGSKYLLPFQDHCLVMSHDRVHFDPSCSVRLPGDAAGHWSFALSDVSYAIAFIKEE